ncbi:hypothetical protein CPB84DRAFT_1749980 [Gymnopilus junonius]|uniref:Secreted protein n=1 Tax=Gymnopilus junonius TaxID=109634 RepID=A0A9P5TIW7_GYMJU|nr:hypothetical protein CPB84DRAFT_1749980 [Gymnopilus junonius]
MQFNESFIAFVLVAILSAHALPVASMHKLRSSVTKERGGQGQSIPTGPPLTPMKGAKSHKRSHSSDPEELSSSSSCKLGSSVKMEPTSLNGETLGPSPVCCQMPKMRIQMKVPENGLEREPHHLSNLKERSKRKGNPLSCIYLKVSFSTTNPGHPKE